MSDSLDEIYKTQIKAEAKDPYHFHKNEGAEYAERAYNPVCGDRFDIYFDIENQKLINASFNGFGCMISKASTSLMIRTLENKTLEELGKLAENVIEFFEEEKEDLIDEMKLFSNKSSFKGRMDCITLPWKAIKKFIEKNEN